MKFCVVSCVHNAKEFIQHHLDSVKGQKHVDFVHVVIDDASTDGTFELLKEEKKSRGKDFKLLHKPARGGAVESLRLAMDNLPPLEGKDVIVELDGDDWFTNDEALRKIEEAHADGYLSTYGNYRIEYDPDEWLSELPEYLSANISGPKLYALPIREQVVRGPWGPWRYTAVRTFRKFLWDLLPEDVWSDAEGDLVPHCKDILYFLPIIEMIGLENLKFIDKELMVYNFHHRCDFVPRGGGCGPEARETISAMLAKKSPIPKLSNINELRDKFDIPVVFMKD
mgnify:CR=1 FL=1